MKWKRTKAIHLDQTMISKLILYKSLFSDYLNKKRERESSEFSEAKGSENNSVKSNKIRSVKYRGNAMISKYLLLKS